MENINIEIISKEIIKPSSPTPQTLKKYPLSFLDQMAPPIFMPLIYFYPLHSKLSNSQRSDELKKSLSRILTRFYPLAGRVVDDRYVDCNDEGVPYFEGEADCTLDHVIKNPVAMDMVKFLPYKLDDVQNLGMAVKVTFFRCGGVAIGVVVSHKIADALSFFMFTNSWAMVARNVSDDLAPRPKFESAAIFPPRDVAGFKPSTGLVKEELVSKIFTFPASKISILKERYSNGGDNEFPPSRPSRVEALSAFLWTRFVSTTELKPNPNKIFTVLHAVNLRTRLEPPLSEEYFGNISRLAIAMPTVGENGPVDGGLEVFRKVREALRAVDSEYVAKVRVGDSHLNVMKERMARANRGELATFNFTSLCRFPLYEADFGWGKPIWVGSACLPYKTGKPIWVGSACLPYKNLVTFIDTPSGDAIEAWINLKKDDMEKFEADLELQAFLSPPSLEDDKSAFEFQKLEIVS